MSEKGRRTTATDLQFEKLLRMPVKWSCHGNDWRIGAGKSNFLIAKSLHEEMARVRELLPLYDAIPIGRFAAAMMRRDLDRAARAMIEGDVTAMIHVFESLKGYKA